MGLFFNREIKAPRVLMNKKTGNLVEYFPTIFGGNAICWDFLNDTPFNAQSPMIFDDDEHFDLNEYEDLGEL